MHCFTCTVVVKFVCFLVIFEIIFIELSEQVLTHRCKLGKEKMLDNCSIDYIDMSMWCDGSIFTGIPDPRTAKIKTQAPPTYAEVMYLNNSCVETINPAILSQYRYLRKLYLDDNCIGNLGRQTFSRCIRLVEIVLSRNKLTTIDNDAFAGLKVLDTLILSKNSLSKITEDVFALLSNLRVLDLSDNSINYIREQAFFKLQKLQELNLSGNRLNVISQKHFSNLKNLRILSLRGNHIITIHAFAFFGSQLLQSIDLGYNNITCLSQKIFMDNNELASIKLNNNSLRQPRSEWFRELHKRKERPTTFSASLSGNPWSCDCNSYDYWVFLSNLNDEEWEETFDFRCSFPANRKGEKIFSLPQSNIPHCIYGNNEEGLCPGETDQAPPPSISTKTSKPLITTTAAAATTTRTLTTTKTTTVTTKTKAKRASVVPPSTSTTTTTTKASVMDRVHGDGNFFKSHYLKLLVILLALVLCFAVLCFCFVRKKKIRKRNEQKRPNKEMGNLRDDNRSSDDVISQPHSYPLPAQGLHSQRHQSNTSETPLLYSVSDISHDSEELGSQVRESRRRTRNDSGCYSIHEEQTLFRRSLPAIPEGYICIPNPLPNDMGLYPVPMVCYPTYEPVLVPGYPHNLNPFTPSASEMYQPAFRPHHAAELL